MAENKPGYCLQVKVHGARNLPKADTFGKIDAYLVVELPVQGGVYVSHKTKTVKGNYNPAFDEKFGRSFGADISRPVKIQLWDADVTSDEQVGEAEISLAQLPLIAKEIPFHLKKDFKPSSGDHASVVVSVGVVPDFDYMLQRCAKWEGLLSDPIKKVIQIPLPFAQYNFPVTGVYLTIEYEDNGNMDLFLCETTPSFKDNVMCGFAMKGDYGQYKTKRRTAELDHAPWSRGKLEQVYVETKIDDLSPFSNFGIITIWASKVKKLYGEHMGTVAVAHGWKGIMNYETAKKTLSKVEHDDDQQCIYFNLEHGYLRDDFDTKNSDISLSTKCGFFHQGIFADISHKNTTKRTHTFYSSPKKIKSVEVSQSAALDDLPYPVMFSQINLSFYQFEDSRVADFLTVFPLFS